MKIKPTYYAIMVKQSYNINICLVSYKNKHFEYTTHPLWKSRKYLFRRVPEGIEWYTNRRSMFENIKEIDRQYIKKLLFIEKL
jgi:hypothetical protein